jgi:hypothetical protein
VFVTPYKASYLQLALLFAENGSGLYWLALACRVTYREHAGPIFERQLDLCYEVAYRKGRPIDRPNLHHRATSRLHLFFTAEMYE